MRLSCKLVKSNQQNYQALMSISNIQSQNQQVACSHRNQPPAAPAPHSQTTPAAIPQQKQWIATFLDGQYYLTDPDSINKLKNIEAEIEKERGRLAQLELDNSLSHNNSFLSFQDDPAERRSNKSFCTEFDQSRQFNKQQKVTKDLEQEEEQYREKLKLAQREKLQLKKNMKLQQKKQQQPVPLPTPPQSRRKSSHKEKVEEVATIPAAQKSVKANVQEEKSYHKSRIEKSIKESGKVNEELNQSPQKSVKAPSQAVQQSQVQQQPQAKEKTEKSIKIIVVQPDHKVKPQEELTTPIEKSAKGSISPLKSVKASQKQEKQSVKAIAVEANEVEKPAPSQKSVNVKELSVKEEAVKAASVKGEAVKTASVKQPSEKPPASQKSAKIEAIEGNKSIKAPSVSLNPDELISISPAKSHKSNQLQLLEVEDPKYSEKKSIQQSEKVSNAEKSQSQKAESVKASEKHSIKQENAIQIDKQSQKAKQSEKAFSQHPSKQASQKQTPAQGQLQQQTPKSVRSPSIRASSKHSKVRQLEKSIKLSEKLSAQIPIVQNQPEVTKEPSQIKQEIQSNAGHISQKSAPIKEDQARSRKSSKVIEEEDKSKKNSINAAPLQFEESKSVKSSIKSQKQANQLNIEEGSRKSYKLENDVVSRKSSKKAQNQAQQVASRKSKQSVKEEIISKKSSAAQNIEEFSQKSAKIASSKKDQILSQKKEEVVSNRKEEIISNRKEEIISNRKEEIISNRKEEIISNRKEEIISNRKEEVASNKNEEILSNKKVDITSVKKEDTVSIKKEDNASIKNGEILRNKKQDVLSNKKQASKKSQPINQPSPSSPLSRKSKQQDADSKSVVSQHRSFTKKSAAPLVEIITGHPPQDNMVNKSIQWSRLSEPMNATPIKIQQVKSQIPSSSVQESLLGNEVSVKESSCVQVVINHQLQPQVQVDVPEYDMRKHKGDDHQSEKKSRSFVIHSRNGSVKDKLSNSQISSPSRKSKDLSSVQSVTKGEIIKLHQQIALLQDKLKRVEERQEQMEKLEGTLTKIHFEQHQQEVKQKQRTEQAEEVQKPQANQKQEEYIQDKQEENPKEPQLPVVDLTGIQVRVMPRLQIQSSILQVNTMEEVRKKQERESENGEKEKLKEEIGRLKRIIRDMQIEKIRSIDLEGEEITPQASRVEKESISSVENTQPRRFGSSNKRLLEDAGRIVHNNSGFPMETPRRKSISKLRASEEEISEVGELPPDTSNKRSKGKFYVQARRGELASRIGQKEKDFHSFIESSRVIAEQTGKTEPEHNNQLKNFSKVAVSQDVDYSRLVQEMRKPNPQEEQVLPQIHLRDLQMPTLPDAPQAGMSQEELLALARTTYMAFGIDVQAEGRQLCVKKYKNCVIFSLDGQHHQCVLWHFSGKFYMGSWRAGEPGEGEKDGQGLEMVPDKHIYKGQFLAGKRHGSGILKQANGNIYDGQWADGVKSGRGVYLDAATRVLYSGEWREGRKEGQGFLKLSEKEYYYGTFVKSIKEGFGVEVFVNGDKYRGQYRAGKFHGRGKYLWANGSCYQGQFHEGVRHGQGSWRSARTNPDIYIGSYDKDKKTGYGRYVWANGCMYEGGFANDLKHGKGRLTYQDGKQIKGTWEDGNLISTDPEKRSSDHEDQPLRRSVKVTAFMPASAKRI